MTPAIDPFRQAVAAADPVSPKIPIIGNVTARPLENPADIQEDLIAQLTARVRWTETIEYLKNQGVTTYLEIGSGDVLSGLVKRIDRSLVRLQLSIPENFSSLTT
jgi:[acyl-carrier-protein] S-malonyltransferase